ncbi:hypothetical protein FRC09_020549 [Ceratobasidium sp. 395]|nr:hypothetical protein FRC09_020549 [Ceratobasidium sp. 395]
MSQLSKIALVECYVEYKNDIGKFLIRSVAFPTQSEICMATGGTHGSKRDLPACSIHGTMEIAV